MVPPVSGGGGADRGLGPGGAGGERAGVVGGGGGAGGGERKGAEKERQWRRAEHNERLATANARQAGIARDRAEVEKATAQAVPPAPFLQDNLLRRASAWVQASMPRAGAQGPVAKHDVTVRELLDEAAH